MQLARQPKTANRGTWLARHLLKHNELLKGLKGRIGQDRPVTASFGPVSKTVSRMKRQEYIRIAITRCGGLQTQAYYSRPTGRHHMQPATGDLLELNHMKEIDPTNSRQQVLTRSRSDQAYPVLPSHPELVSDPSLGCRKPFPLLAKLAEDLSTNAKPFPPVRSNP